MRESVQEMWALRVEHINVYRDRIAAMVCLSDERFAFTSEKIIEECLKYCSNLLSHTCVNDFGKTFGAVAVETSTPHLLEHMIIEEESSQEVEMATQAVITYVGKTSWTDRENLKACIELNYANDLQTLKALRRASERLNAILLSAV